MVFNTLFHLQSWMYNLKQLSKKLKRWNYEVFGHVDAKLDRIRQEIDNLDSQTQLQNDTVNNIMLKNAQYRFATKLTTRNLLCKKKDENQMSNKNG